MKHSSGHLYIYIYTLRTILELSSAPTTFSLNLIAHRSASALRPNDLTMFLVESLPRPLSYPPSVSAELKGCV